VSCLLALAPWARAASLDDYLGHVDALSAKFEQQLYDTNTQSKETSKGTIAVHSPNKFRLVYTEPYKQIYVADGENLWSYDEDLEQVTVKRQKNLLANSPAMVLSNPGALDQAYEVKDLGTKKGITWFDLKPKSEDSGFDDVRLGFAGKNLYVMQLKDSFGQMTQLRFSQLQYNPKLPSDTFEFTPPQGVDVIRDNPEAQH
jgi:outer membrane lipoprotein carrier protein